MGKRSVGMSGVIAGESAICTVGKEGAGLTYRGYSIDELAEGATFEEVAYLLIRGELPDAAQLDEYKKRLASMRGLPDNLKTVLEQTPADAHPMDVMRTGCSLLGTLEKEESNGSSGRGSGGAEIAERLIASFPSMLLYWHHFAASGERIEVETEDESGAGHFLHLLRGEEPDELMRRTLDVSLILYAEHEFNASTFTARVAASTLTDFYSAITSAIGVLRGPLHGGANEAAMELISRFTTPEEAEEGVKEALAGGEKLKGFGHPVYTQGDPRTPIIKGYSKKLSELPENSEEAYLYEVSDRIEEVMDREKDLFANVDFWSASTYRFCDIPTSMFTPIFVISRTTG